MATKSTLFLLRRITADITFGGGVNTPGDTLKRYSMSIICLKQNTKNAIGLVA